MLFERAARSAHESSIDLRRYETIFCRVFVEHGALEMAGNASFQLLLQWISS